MMSINRSSSDMPDAARLEFLLENATSMLHEKEALVARIEQAEKTIQETETIIRDKKRSCTGDVPLSPFYDICEALHLDPDDRFPSALREAEAKSDSAKAEILCMRTDTERQIAQLQRRIRRLEEMRPCAGSSPGSLDYELYGVLNKYLNLGIDLTIDEAVGIALATVYQRSADAAEVRRIATRGRFALREVGNCAADVVFDPELRERMAKRHKQLGKWSRHEVMKEYLRIAEEGGDHSTVKAYEIEGKRLSGLPEHILYGLVVCGKGHAMRILKAGKDGLIVVEGNWNGGLNFGRFVPFGEVTWGDNNVVVYSRRPSQREGLERELSVYDYTNPDSVGYESLREALDDANYTDALYFKLTSAGRVARLPLPIRDSLSVHRFRPGKSYDITYYADLVDSAPALFPKRSLKDVISAFIQAARRNLTGQIVVSTITSGGGEHPRLARFSRAVPPDMAKQMYVFFDKEGGEEVSLDQLREITEASRRQHGNLVPRILVLTADEFKALDEEVKRTLAFLTPRRDAQGHPVEAESYFEEQLLRACKDDAEALMDEESGQRVSIRELMQNPLEALIVVERPYDMLGVGQRLAADELAVLDKYPVHGTEDGLERLISRKFEIRRQYRGKGK